MQPASPKGRGARKLSAAVVVLVVACAAATQASGSGGGGVATGEPPKLNAVTCLEQCAGIRTAAVGSLIRLDGKNLDGVDEVRLAADGGRVLVKPREVDAGSVEAKVPEGAVTYRHSDGEVRRRSFVANIYEGLELLETYRRRHRGIVTSRLHCYLPTRSLGMNVDFRPKNRADVRFDGLIDISDAAFDGIREGLVD